MSKLVATIGDLALELWLRRRNSGDLKILTDKGDYIPVKNIADSYLMEILNNKLKNYETERVSENGARNGAVS